MKLSAIHPMIGPRQASEQLPARRYRHEDGTAFEATTLPPPLVESPGHLVRVLLQDVPDSLEALEGLLPEMPIDSQRDRVIRGILRDVGQWSKAVGNALRTGAWPVWRETWAEPERLFDVAATASSFANWRRGEPEPLLDALGLLNRTLYRAAKRTKEGVA